MQDDSPRLRVQLLSLFESEGISHQAKFEVFKLLRARSGIEVPIGPEQINWDRFFKSSELRDVLDSLSYLHSVFKVSGRPSQAGWLRGRVQAAFDAQHAKYQMSEDGSVVLRVDESFETARVSTLAGLEGQRYGGARTEFEAAYKALSAFEPDGKLAVRAIFEACEVVFKLMFKNTMRIGYPEIRDKFTPFVEQHYASDLPALEAAKKMAQSLSAWVAAAQFYRHGQGQEEPNQPPLELAVHLLSEGAAHLRWLIYLDQANLASQT